MHYKNKSTHTFLIRPALAWSPHSQGEDEGEQLLHVHYVGYNESWREWLPRASSRIARSASRVRALFNFTYITTAGVECSGAYHVEGKLRGGLLELAPQRSHNLAAVSPVMVATVMMATQRGSQRSGSARTPGSSRSWRACRALCACRGGGQGSFRWQTFEALTPATVAWPRHGQENTRKTCNIFRNFVPGFTHNRESSAAHKPTTHTGNSAFPGPMRHHAQDAARSARRRRQHARVRATATHSGPWLRTDLCEESRSRPPNLSVPQYRRRYYYSTQAGAMAMSRWHDRSACDAHVQQLWRAARTGARRSLPLCQQRQFALLSGSARRGPAQPRAHRHWCQHWQCSRR